MDPNANGPTNPGVTPPPPPDWGTPPPSQPGWAATPPPAAPPAWGVAAPTSAAGGVGAAVGNAGKNIILRIVGIVVVVAILGGGYFVYQKVVNPDHLGQVIYTTVDPTNTTDCSIPSQVTTVKAGTSVYAVYMWTHRLELNQAVQEEAFKDGTSIVPKFDVERSKASDCMLDPTDLKDIFTDPGVYELKLTVGTEVVADGKLTITP